MTSCHADAVVARLLDLPLGGFWGHFPQHDPLVRRTLFAGGASEKLRLRAVEGSDHASLHFHRLERDPRLTP